MNITKRLTFYQFIHTLPYHYTNISNVFKVPLTKSESLGTLPDYMLHFDKLRF